MCIFSLYFTHWDRETLIYVSNRSIIVSNNGLSPGRRQAIIWSNAGILIIGPLGTNFSEILAEITKFSFKKMYLKVSSAKCRPFCFGLNVLKQSNVHLYSLSKGMGDTIVLCWLIFIYIQNDLKDTTYMLCHDICAAFSCASFRSDCFHHGFPVKSWKSIYPYPPSRLDKIHWCIITTNQLVIFAILWITGYSLYM